MGRCVREMGCQSCVVASIVGSYMVAWYRICFPLLFSALIIIIIIIVVVVVAGWKNIGSCGSGSGCG